MAAIDKKPDLRHRLTDQELEEGEEREDGKTSKN